MYNLIKVLFASSVATGILDTGGSVHGIKSGFLFWLTFNRKKCPSAVDTWYDSKTVKICPVTKVSTVHKEIYIQLYKDQQALKFGTV